MTDDPAFAASAGIVLWVAHTGPPSSTPMVFWFAVGLAVLAPLMAVSGIRARRS